MPQNGAQQLGLVLSLLRQMARWTQGRLEREAGLGQGTVSRMERGDSIDRRKLDRLAAILEAPPGRVQGLLHSLAPYFEDEAPAGSPADLTLDQRQILEHFGRNLAATASDRLARKFRVRRWRADRAAAGAAWQRLRRAPEADRRSMVEAFSDFQTWAVVERLCEESAKAASNDVEEAAHFAALARAAAERTPGAEEYRTWLVGYAAAFEGNAVRVAGDLLRARQVFVESESQLQGGTPIESMDQSRPIYLFGMLLTFRGELDAALSKIDRALALAGTALQRARVLVMRADALKRRSQYREALEALAKARQFAKDVGDPRLSWVIEFNEASYLWEAGEANAAASRLEALRIVAFSLGRTLDIVRLRWLAARIASSQGRLIEAAAYLNEVWNSLADRRIWFDAALAVLELASVDLERGKSREVRKLAASSAYVFAAQNLPTELLGSIQLFWEAVRLEAASAHDAKQLVHALRTSSGGTGEAS